MKMCYRGVSYDYHPDQVRVSETGDSVKFRGRTYTLNSVALNLKESEQDGIIYRGVAFSEARQTRFLGQLCEKKSIGLSVVKKHTKFLGQFSGNDVVTANPTSAIV